MNKQESILIVEDEPDIASILMEALEKEKFKVTIASEGRKALAIAVDSKPNVILIDLGLPDLDGLEVCRLLKNRKETSATAIIFLSGRSTISDIVAGLEMGGDDYVTKPFQTREVVARVRAVLRRVATRNIDEQRESIAIGPLILDILRFEIRVDGQPIAVTRCEFKILWTLASHPGRAFTRDQLIDKIHRTDVDVIDRTIDVHIGILRKKLGSAAKLIETVRGIGYKCKESI